MKKSKIHILLYISFFLLFGCYDYPDYYETEQSDYQNYNRVVGKEGGRILYYSNYSDDDEERISVQVDIPPGAIDTTVIFNMYQFEELNLMKTMAEDLVIIGSPFIYFIPFYYSDGYHNHTMKNPLYRLNVNFNEPIEIKYNFTIKDNNNEYLTHDYDDFELNVNYSRYTQSYKLYKIKIPRLNEWAPDNNISIKWNNQGYPDGFLESHLRHIISGRKNEKSGSYLDEEISLVNWEEVMDYNFNTKDIEIKFKTDNINYLYVLAKVISIDKSQLPEHIQNIVKSKYPDVEYKTISFDRDYRLYSVSLVNGVKLSFDRDYNLRIERISNIEQENLPEKAQKYFKTNFYIIDFISFYRDYKYDEEKYTVKISNGDKLYFTSKGEYIGMVDNNFSYSNLPSDIIDYLATHYQDIGISYIVYDDAHLLAGEITDYYHIVLNDGTILYFKRNGEFYHESKYIHNRDSIPEKILDYLNQYHKDISIVDCYTYKDAYSKIYYLRLSDITTLTFDDSGNILMKEIDLFKKEHLHDSIKNYISSEFPDKTIIEVHYMKDFIFNEEFFYIYLSNGQEIHFNGKFEVEYYSGDGQDVDNEQINTIPDELNSYLKTQFPSHEVVYYNKSKNNSGELIYEFTLTNGIDLSFNSNFELEYFYVTDGIKNNLPLTILNHLNSFYTEDTISKVLYNNDLWEIDVNKDITLNYNRDQEITYLTKKDNLRAGLDPIFREYIDEYYPPPVTSLYLWVYHYQMEWFGYRSEPEKFWFAFLTEYTGAYVTDYKPNVVIYIDGKIIRGKLPKATYEFKDILDVYYDSDEGWSIEFLLYNGLTSTYIGFVENSIK